MKKKKSAKKEEKPKNLRQEEKKETDAPKEKVGELISKEDQEFMDKARAACDKIIDNTSKLLQAVNNEVTNNNLK